MHAGADATLRTSIFPSLRVCVRPLSQTASPGAKPPRGGTPAKAPAPAPPPAALPTIRIASPVCARGAASGAHPSRSHTHGHAHAHAHAPLSLLSGTRLDFSSPPGADAPPKVTSPVAAASVADVMASFGFFSPRPGLVIATAEAVDTPEFALAAAHSELVGLSAQLAARSETADALAELATERAAHGATRAAAALAREAADAAEARAAEADAAAKAAKAAAAAADAKQASLCDEVRLCTNANTHTRLCCYPLLAVHTPYSTPQHLTRACCCCSFLRFAAARRAGGDARRERGGCRVPRSASDEGGRSRKRPLPSG
jgi:hypothetical protein